MTTASGRPVTLTVLCLFTFTWSAVMVLLLTAALMHTRLISDALNEYAAGPQYSSGYLHALILPGILLHTSILTGAVMIWYGKKRGYPILILPALFLATAPAFTGGTGMVLPVIYILMILLFGIHYRSRKNLETDR